MIVLGVVALIIIGAALGHTQQKKRQQALREWAASLGLIFSEGKERGFDARFPEFACFRNGEKRYAQNITEGHFEGRWVCAFDYHYQTTSTRTVTDSKGRTRTKRQTNHHHFSAVILEPNVQLKELFIRPEGLFDKVASFFGKNDLDFGSAAFSRRYHVTAPDRRWAYDVLHARAIEYLLTVPTCTIQFAPKRVLILHGQSRLDAEAFHAALKTVDTLLDMLPDYIREQQRLAPEIS